MGSPGEHGGCVSRGALFCPLEWRPEKHPPHLYSACHLSAHCGRTLLCRLRHWKRLGALGLNGSLGRVVVLSWGRAAIFGFPVLILNQVPFESSGTEQIASRVNCRVRNTWLSWSSQSLSQSTCQQCYCGAKVLIATIWAYEPLASVDWNTWA